MTVNAEQQEPTMEEILASIRRIISEDDQENDNAPVLELSEPAENIDESSLTSGLSVPTSNTESNDIAFQAEPVHTAETNTVSEAELPPIFKEDDAALREAANFESKDILTVDKQAKDELSSKADIHSTLNGLQSEIVNIPSNMKETTFPTEADQDVLVTERSASSAANALNKLSSAVSVSRDNTLDSIVRELLKPLLAEWLDTHLPAIVEEKVEEEVKRISRMSR